MSCLDEQQLHSFAAGEGDDAQRTHVASCSSCREALTRLSQLTFDSQRTVRRDEVPDGVLAEGASVGQYVVRRRLGAGAMGAVYAAWDARLEREVALKVLHLDGDLLTEARLLAKLSHPNVVAVHEVLTWNGRAVLVMELVHGQTLRAWLATPRPLKERLAVLRQCADGLAAAHAAGIVHRDFKPDNVLVDAERRPRLLDFGLALHGQVAGGLAGSPAYMALRQLEGAPADAASDQFSWWVTVHEALTGRVPHNASTLPGLTEARRAGKLELSAVPLWLRPALTRGLSNDAAARFSSMRDAARALTPPRRGVWVAGGAATLAVVAALAWPRHSACDELPAPDALVQRAQHPALATVARDYAEASARCRALPAAEQPDRASCLATVGRELDVALAAVEGAEFSPDFAARVLKRVRPVARCETTPLPPATPPEPDRDAVIGSLRAQLRFDQLRQQGDFAGAVALASAHAAEVADAGSPSVRAWAGLDEASGFSSLGRVPQTLERLRGLEGLEGLGPREQAWVALGRWLFECYSSSRQHCLVAERQAKRTVAQLDEPWANAFALEVRSITGGDVEASALVDAWRRLPGAEFELERAVLNELGAALASGNPHRWRVGLALGDGGGRHPAIAQRRLSLRVSLACLEGDLAAAAAALAELDALPGDNVELLNTRLEARASTLAARDDSRGALELLPRFPTRTNRDRYRRLISEFDELSLLRAPRVKEARRALELIAGELQDADHLMYEASLRRAALFSGDVAQLERLMADDAEPEDAWQLAVLKGDAAAEQRVYDEARTGNPAANEPIDRATAAWLLLEEALQAGRFEEVAQQAPAQREACPSISLDQQLRLAEAWARWNLGEKAAACRVLPPGARRWGATPRQQERFETLRRACPMLGVSAWPK